MVGRLRRSAGRQFAAVVLIFALMLQGMAVAVAAGRSVADATGANPDWPGFEVCHHSGPGDAAASDTDATIPGGAPASSGAHCTFCLAGASHALPVLLPSVAFHVIIREIAPWSFTAWRLPRLTVDASARPRGPPPA